MIGSMVMKLGARRGFRHLQALDADYFIGLLDDDVVLECPGRTALSGRFVGRDAVADWYRRYFARLATLEDHVLHIAVERQFAVGLTNTILSEYEEIATLRGGEVVRNKVVDVTEARRGKVVASRTYIFDLQAFEAAFGVADPSAGEIRA